MTDLRILKRLFTYYNPTIKQDTWKHVFFMYKKDLRRGLLIENPYKHRLNNAATVKEYLFPATLIVPCLKPIVNY